VAPELAVGLPVRDNTGTVIGRITKVGADASGAQVATIRMGVDTVQVEADRLTVHNGLAEIDATPAELRGMLRSRR
jgi:hypothetical protein